VAKTLDPHPEAPEPPAPALRIRPATSAVPAETLHRLVKDNIGFVVKLACEYRNLGIPLEDLIGEGSVGLMHAARRFDPERGTKFVTYAAAWVRKSILRALSQGTRTIRIPAYHQDRLRLYQRAEARLSDELGRHPRREEISRRMDSPLARVDALLRSRIFEVSLDADDAGAHESLLALVADPAARDPERDLLRDESHWIVESALTVLSIRERQIIVARFGLTGDPPASLRDLADIMRLSRERVRQIEDRAKQKIRRHLEKKSLCARAAGANIVRRKGLCARHPKPLRQERGGEGGPA